MKSSKISNKQKKIDRIMSLVNGEVTPADIGPKMEIRFNTPEGDIYLINDKPVCKSEFDTLNRTLPMPFYDRFYVSGRPGGDGPMPDEFYV